MQKNNFELSNSSNSDVSIPPIPYVDIAAQYFEYREEILAAIDKVLSSGQYILGEEVELFENNFAKLCGVKHAISVANGTDALIIALKALNIGNNNSGNNGNDEVITVPNSWISSVSSIVLAGATPILVDVGDDQNIDPTLIEKAITPRTKAIIPVHLTGKMADMYPIIEIAKKYKLAVIEDAAQAVNATYHGRKAGSIGDINCFSLHPLKNLNAAGDAGIITTNNNQLAEQIKLLRNHGIVSREDIRRWGFNSRLDTVQAAILNVKIKHIDEITNRRRQHAEVYREQLKDLVNDGYLVCPQDASGCVDVYHLFVIQAKRRDQLKEFLQQQGIGTAIHYPVPIHRYTCAQELHNNVESIGGSFFPIAEKQSQEIISLPVHQNLISEQQSRIINAIHDFYQNKGSCL